MAKVSKSKASAAELLEALDELQSEKGITKEYMVESLKLALEAAYRKNYETEENVGVLLYYEQGKDFIIELKGTLDEWTAPLLFSGFVKSGIYK
jgi:hypothetical protein